MKTLVLILSLSVASGPTIVLRLVAFAAATGLLLVAYRWIHRRSPLLAVVFATGIVARAIAGVALFAISFFRLPLFTGLQLGGGFWTLAVDGRSYYDLAAHAVVAGLGTISDTLPSPLFIRVLAAWMSVFGVSPASAVLLNVVFYAASAVLIVICAALPRAGRGLRPTAAGVALFGLTFSPALLIFGTQPLKDPLCTMLMICVIAGARIWWVALKETTARDFLLMGSGTVLMAVGIYGIAGVRAYVAVFMIIALAAAATYNIVFGVDARPRLSAALLHAALLAVLASMFVMGVGIYGVAGVRAYVAAFTIIALAATAARSIVIRVDARPRLGGALLHAALLAVLGAVFVIGAGPYLDSYKASLWSFVTGHATLDTARSGFVAAGGATSLDAMGAGSAPAPGRIERLTRGYAALFVPISVLRATSVVTFQGGAGLLAITDIDTVVTDLTVLAALYLFLTFARAHGVPPGPVFVLLLAILLSGLLAYVVTNYGTLFRLRLLAVTPLWMLPVMLSEARPASENVSVT